MKKKITGRIVFFVLLLILSAACMFGADLLQRDMGNTVITEGFIETEKGNMAYKLYVPSTASSTNKAPGVLLIHGYQNDHETCAAYAIELARRGAVVLSIDAYGHGLTEPGLRERGYVNHKVSVNYGNETGLQEIGSTERYRLMMNFSNLSFFKDYYSKDAFGNSIKDSSVGGNIAYRVLANLNFVDSSRLAISGHSMGTWASWSVAAEYSGTAIEPKATVLQCGELFRKSVYDNSIRFNNVLLLQAKWDEFSYFRDYEKIVSDELLKSSLRTEFLGTTAANSQWNTTYGSFSDGSARRMELLYTNHRLTTHNRKGLAVALEWFDNAIGLDSKLSYTNNISLLKEYLVLAAMICTLTSMFPLLSLLLDTGLFKDTIVNKPDQYDVLPMGKWLSAAFVSILLSGLSFPFMTQLGHALLPLPENLFRMTVGNGFLSYYALLIITTGISILITKLRNKKNAIPGYTFSPVSFVKSFILALICFGLVYGINYLFVLLFGLDLRFIWPFFRPFNKIRLVQFAVYLPVYLLFYCLVNTRVMRDLRTRATYVGGASVFVINWLLNFFVMGGGVMLIVLLEYIPFFMDLGPGADLLFGSTFGGPFMSILILFVPQLLFFSLVGTYGYRKTGKPYLGAILSALLACWIVTGGSSFF